MGPSLKMVRKLHPVQNVAAHMLTGSSTCHNVIPALHELYWLLLLFRAQFKVLLVTYKGYKALYGLGLGYMKDSLMLQVPAWALRSSRWGWVAFPGPTIGWGPATEREGLLCSWAPAFQLPPCGGSLCPIIIFLPNNFRNRAFKTSFFQQNCFYTPYFWLLYIFVGCFEDVYFNFDWCLYWRFYTFTLLATFSWVMDRWESRI